MFRLGMALGIVATGTKTNVHFMYSIYNFLKNTSASVIANKSPFT